ncbi:MAG: DUF5076 domain-containing protein [Steroidobacteraceae bacterium]
MSSKRNVHALPPPPEAATDVEAVEVLRGWIIDNRLHISIAHQALGENCAIWGQLLAEVVSHIADALSQQYGQGRESVLERITTTLLNELEHPSAVEGSIQGPVQ